MTTKDRIMHELSQNRGEYISGQQLADSLDISRNAVWKAISSLQEEGYDIDAVKNKGYCLNECDDIFDKPTVLQYLNDTAFFDITVFDEVDSTNTLLGVDADEKKDGTVYCAKSQTSGKGRRGRSFLSPNGTGVYFSVLLRPQIEAKRAVFLTSAAAVAVCRALEKNFDIQPKIKWVNDIFVNDKKVCGILTQAVIDFETQTVERIILGIGINVYEPKNGFGEELSSIAGALFKQKTHNARARIAAEILNELKLLLDSFDDKTEILNEYRKRCFVPGKDVTVIRGEERFNARAIDIDDDCSLVVQDEAGETKHLFSGEISIRL